MLAMDFRFFISAEALLHYGTLCLTLNPDCVRQSMK